MHHAELTLTPELMAGEVWRRAYQKPLGYPGDYQVMVAAYDHDPLRSGHGQGLYGEVLHALMTTHLSVCIQGRSALTRDAILAHAAENPNGGGVYRVANVGAGPAREIEQMLAAPSLPRRMEITLVEQDTEALDYVHGRIFPHLMRHSGQVRLNGLNASFVDLLRGGRLYDALGPQDAIYSLGLIDYFAQTTARRVARGLYEKLKPGGLMVLCNMKQAPHSTYWPLEFLCDWSLVYRNEEQMRDLLRDIPAEHVSIETDPSDRVLVLFARKPL